MVGVLGGQRAVAQEPAASFAQASVLLVSGDTVRGGLDYFPEKNLLVVRPAKGGLRALPAGQVQLAAAQEKVLQLSPWSENIQAATIQSPEPKVEPLRRSSLELYNARFYQKHFEPVSSKRIDTTWVSTVRIFRSLLWQDSRSSGPRAVSTFFEQLTDGPLMLLQRPVGVVGTPLRFFLLRTDSRLEELTDAREQLLGHMGPQAARLQKAMQRQRLSFGQQADLPFIVGLANSLLLEQQ